MFTTTNAATPAVTHGKFKNLIIEADADGDYNVTLNYEEGYLNGEDFVPLGVNHIIAKNKSAYTDDEGNEVAEETGYTDFLTDVMATGGSLENTESFIQERI